MGAYYEDTNRCEIRLESTVDGETIDRIRTVVDSIAGAELVGVAGRILSVDFYPAMASESLIVESLESAGVPPDTNPKGGFLARKLEKMAERNRKEFGDGPLDCCDLPKE